MLPGTDSGSGTDTTPPPGTTTSGFGDTDTETEGFDPGTDSGEPPEGEFGCWSIEAIIEDPDRSGAAGVAASEDGIRAGTQLSTGSVYASDLGGAFEWEYGVSVGNQASVLAVALLPDGDTLAAAQTPQGGGDQLWLGRLSADGELVWETSLGPTYGQAWVSAHISTAPSGDVYVAWDTDGLAVSRVDPATGDVAWTAQSNYAANIINWSRGGLATTPDGDALTLRRWDYGLELELWSAADGMMLDTFAVTDPTFAEARPADLEVLPDGSIFVLANADSGPALLELDGDGEVLASHTFVSVDDPEVDTMAWDSVTERFLLSGVGRNDAGTQRPWRLTTDRDGTTELDVLGGMPFSIWGALASTRLPGGGFVETRFPSLYAYAITCD